MTNQRNVQFMRAIAQHATIRIDKPGEGAVDGCEKLHSLVVRTPSESSVDFFHEMQVFGTEQQLGGVLMKLLAELTEHPIIATLSAKDMICALRTLADIRHSNTDLTDIHDGLSEYQVEVAEKVHNAWGEAFGPWDCDGDHDTESRSS